MRSKEVEKAIKDVEYAKSFGTSGIVPSWLAIDILMNYISELEEKIEVCTDTGAKLISTEFIKNNFIHKDVIRDKIKELENELKSIQDKLGKNILFSESEFYSFSEYSKWKIEMLQKIKDTNAKIQILKKLLGE